MFHVDVIVIVDLIVVMTVCRSLVVKVIKNDLHEDLLGKT
jgi:hypothetical protein